MSFILDALRKSEHARERRALPGLVDLPVSRAAPSRLPWILGGVAVLLLVNIAVLVWVLARPAAAPGAVPARAPAPAAAAAPAPPAAPRAAVPLVRPLAAETEAGADPELERAAPTPPAAAAPRAAARAAPPAYAAERAAAEREFHPGVATTGLPTIHQLAPQVTAGLPPLNIDLHVYSGDAAQRFVIINGQRLHEGGQLKEGPTVERITQEGAILNHQGTRFLLPRE
ncbi:MAG TPA: general secretion pathway protein GspB [Steroidobacteraceae bacterium]|nr:general secretion pathway protein GspB [Steroidobacteraceae bacterium]